MSLAHLVERLEQRKARFDSRDALSLLPLLRQLARRRFRDAALLARVHEAVLFVRAFPASPRLLQAAEEMLSDFGRRVAALPDTAPLEAPDVSGMAGTGFATTFGYEMARHLLRRYGRAVSIDWDAYEHPERLGLVLPALIPVLRDEASVEPHVPYRSWLEAAGGLPWLLAHIGTAEQYDALDLPLHWELGDSPATRTRMRLPVRRIFYHGGPLIQRREVSLDGVIAGEPLPARKLPVKAGERMIGLARDTSAVRYRELHGFTYGDPRHVHEIDAGRGVLVFLWGLRPEHRLPLRAYHAALIWKNGVPIGYFEALSLFERMEAGFNLYYTFREGETAWLYARLLAMFHQRLGVTCIWVDPYQIGHENEEAIHSGAFWFYRKLGFRSVDPAIRGLTAREERRIARQPGYRTPPALLRRLVRCALVYELPGGDRGAWDRFNLHRVGIALAGGRAPAVSRGLARLGPLKRGPEELDYLRRMQRDHRLRAAVLRLGSR
jgi:hypothetical protein